MTLPYRQRRRLRGIDRMLRRSDPDLASMLSVFGHLGAAEQLPSREQLPASRPWARALARGNPGQRRRRGAARRVRRPADAGP